MGMDTIYEVETPEGVILRGEVAGPVPRILAYSVDLLCRSVFLVLLSVLIVPGGLAGKGVLAIVAFLLEWFYPVFFECLHKAQFLFRNCVNFD